MLRSNQRNDVGLRQRRFGTDGCLRMRQWASDGLRDAITSNHGIALNIQNRVSAEPAGKIDEATSKLERIVTKLRVPLRQSRDLE
jgi:hypothetical protein